MAISRTGSSFNKTKKSFFAAVNRPRFILYATHTTGIRMIQKARPLLNQLIAMEQLNRLEAFQKGF